MFELRQLGSVLSLFESVVEKVFGTCRPSFGGLKSLVTQWLGKEIESNGGRRARFHWRVASD